MDQQHTTPHGSAGALAETLTAANAMMQEEISPISDVRGTSDYKRLLLRQLLLAHFLRFAPGLEVGELI